MAYSTRFTSVQRFSTANKSMLKKALKIDPQDTGQDDWLELLLKASKADADWYLDRSFGDTPGCVPPNVDLWVIRDAIAAFENPNPRVTFASQNGVGSETLSSDDLMRFQGLAQPSLRSPISSSSGTGIRLPTSP